ncbi:polygalacturonase-like [Senna tora]|uniref:Polygalacturonase-like n=1 Tax=Senna tora TaxID=362788 RepID=A0A834WDC5_9FABA|nr:polygalacturonase-like [Senna tora]
MYMQSPFARCAFLLFLVSATVAQPKSFDIANFGGKPDGDITEAITNAWKEACASVTPSKITIPKGNFKLGVVDLKGPCKAPIEIQVDGTILAPPDIALMKGAYQWVKFQYLNGFTLSGTGTFDGQGPIAWKQNDCAQNKNCKMPTMNFGFNFLNNSIVLGVTSKDSKNFHVNVLGCNNFTFDGFKIIAPPESPNTDGIHIGRSTEVHIKNAKIGTGDDCVSLGDGSKNVSVENTECGPGHGISVGSLGRYDKEDPVEGFTVKNCTLTNTDNGVRIKTWPGTPGAITVTDMHFEDIVMNNVSNPTPSKIKISKVTFKNIRGTSATPEGVVLICSSGVPCEGVELSDIKLTFNGAEAKAKCANVKPLIQGAAPACAA